MYVNATHSLKEMAINEQVSKVICLVRPLNKKPAMDTFAILLRVKTMNREVQISL
jgi:hypothetical protein